MAVYRRMGLVFVFSSLAVSGYFSINVPIPKGPWVGMYGSFWAIWIAVGLGLVLLLILIQYSEVPWSVVFIAAILSALIFVNLSRLWGVPFGIRDPFRHLFLIKSNIVSFERNVYPLFHVFNRALVSATGLSEMTVLGTTPLIASSVGVGLLALALRRLGIERRVQQTAVVAGVPIVSAGLIARPYTFGVVFILVFIWTVTTDIRSRSIQVLLLIFTFGVLWLHPVGFIVGSAVIVTAIVVGIFLDRYPIPSFQSPPSGWWVRKSFVVVMVAAFAVHILFFSSVGGIVVSEVTDQTSDSDTPTPQETPQGGGSSGSDGETQSDTGGSSTADENTPLLLQIQTEFFEFVRRASLGLLLFGAAAVVAVREAVSKRLHYLTTVIGIAGVLILFLFILIDILRVPIFSARRILAFAPILLLPVFARLLQTRTVVRLVLAVAVVISGAAIMYDSPAITGGLQNGATSAQVDGYQWYHDHGSAPLTGSGSTFWVALGLYGQDTVLKWGNGTWGLSRWQERDARYPWQVTDRPDHIVAVSDFARAQSRYRAIENGQSRPVAQLEQFQIVNERIYDNGNLRFYRQLG